MRLLRFWLPALFLALAACSAPAEKPLPAGANIVTVIGAVHGQHRRSKTYSLDVLRAAIRKFNPDIIMVELPEDRFAKASKNFKKYGAVRDSRADDFPELTDVVFPLREELGFTMVPVAAWTQKIADDRKTTERQLQDRRAGDWAVYQAATEDYNQTVSGRSDDPEFVHSDDYDEAVKARQETYERLFGDDLGPGGWKAINAAHFANMAAELDRIKGQEKRVLILFGAWHKYKIMEALEARDDVQVRSAAALFAG